jgi:dephospho-CoA kinase
MPGSGKSLIVDYFKQRGWQVIHFGEITMHELKTRGLHSNETNERIIREELRKTHGMDAYAKLLLSEIKKALSVGPTVIDGLYSWAEYKFLRQKLENQMLVIAVFTPRPLRYERLSRRLVRPLSSREAELRDFAETENLEKGGPIAMADYTILNDGSEEDLFSTVDRLLATLYPQDLRTKKIIEKGGKHA